MNTLFLASSNAPQTIKDSLLASFSSVRFHKLAPKGANGYVFFGRETITGRDIAVKYYWYGGDSRYHAEPQQLARISNPNIIPILHAGMANREWAFFSTPFCRNGDLDDLISGGNIGNRKAVVLTAGVLNGLACLHGARFLHRDLKPQNILMNDNDEALIGDFGSLKYMPQESNTVPGSGHSLLYRPPESVNSGMYGIKGDIYQIGILLYQLLGGFLPYDETQWLNRSQRGEYERLNDPAERTIFADNILKERIRRGRILDISSLPPWVCRQLRSTVRKATHKDPRRRFQSAAAFRARLHRLQSRVRNWLVVDGNPTLIGPMCYRVVPVDFSLYAVEKKRTGNWRRDNAFPWVSLCKQVRAIDDHVSP